MLKLGSVRLELFPTGLPRTVNANGGEQVIGFKHLAFEVPRLELAIAALRADGIEPDTDQLRNLVRKRGHQDFAAQPLELFQQPVSIRGRTSGSPESPEFDDRQ